MNFFSVSIIFKCFFNTFFCLFEVILYSCSIIHIVMRMKELMSKANMAIQEGNKF